MKRSLVLLILFFQFTFFAEGQVMFQQTYAAEGAHFVLQSTDGGYFILGSIFNGSPAICFIKTDVDGNFIWAKAIDRGLLDDAGVSGQQTTDGGYIIVGYITGGWDYDVYLIKTNLNGDTLWTKTLGGTYEDKGYSVQQTIDEGYIIVGETKSFGAGNNDVYLIKTDSSGNSLWAKTFGGTGFDFGEFVRQTSDGGFIITGYTFLGTGIYDVYLIKTDANGDSLWTKTFGGNDVDIGYSVQQTFDGGYIIVGSTKSFGAGNNDVYLIKTNSSGDTLWTKTFGGTGEDYGFSVVQTTDGGLVICGSLQTAFNTDVYLIRTDANGDSLWTKTYGGIGSNGLDHGGTVAQTIDGGFVIAGFTQFLGGGSTNAYLIKTDANGNSGCNEANPASTVTVPATLQTNPATIVSSPNTIVSTELVSAWGGGYGITLCSTLGIQSAVPNPESVFIISPNPARTSFTLTTFQYSLISAKIFSTLGEEMYTSPLTTEMGIIQINIGNYNPGIYFIKVETENGTSVQKLIKQ